MNDASPPPDEMSRTKRRRFLMPLRRPRWALVLTGLALMAVLIVTVIWSSRLRIASDVVQRELDKRGVQATYRVTRVGFQKQRLENVVIGDPRNPDLTARFVDVEVALGWRQTRVSNIVARGVRLRGRVEGGKLRLGEVDKLLPPPTGRPFRLPNQRIDVADAQMQLDTPAGRVGLAIQGRGNLAYSFEGRIAAFAPRLASGDCRAERLRANFAVRTKDEQPSVDGPLTAGRARCGGVDVARPELALRATLAPALDGWRGESGVRAAGFHSGGQSLAGLSGRVTFDGNRRSTAGAVDLAAASGRAGGYRAVRPRIKGRYRVSPDRGDVALLADVQAGGLSAAGTAALETVADTLSSAGGTPVEPIGDALAAALRRAAAQFSADGTIRFVRGPGFQAARLDQLELASQSGARLALRGKGVSYFWPGGQARIDGEVALAGGGLPATRIALRQSRPGAPIEGEARIAPMAAGSARLELAPIRFASAGDGQTRVETRATLSGPFNDGRVDGLVLPVSGRFGRGGFAFGERCTPVAFRSLQAAGLRLGATGLTLCPTGSALVSRAPGGALRAAASIRAPRLQGQLGRSPLSIAASGARFDLSQPGFTSSDVAVRLGREGAIQRLDLASLSGTFNQAGVIGRFAGGSGKIANVPLLLGDAEGRWSVQRGDLLVEGAMRVADEADPPRFYPLVTRDFRLTLDGSEIAATGWLDDPETGTRITRATIAHNLREGRGNAVLDVPGIAFDPAGYQPEQLTRFTTGVVALIRGTLTGQGRINWGPEGTTSTGRFSTEKMDLAAPFGPVTGLTTTVEFTDLLGLTSAPGQLAQVDRIQTGIDVLDGQIRYQLLPDQRVRVESGRWPFAGGELLLDETLLDFSKPTNKRLVFQVRGLDAAAFIQQMEFSNISATGTFDGVIPMEFDERGGRIVGGRLVARPEGGTLSYIGELTDKELGAYGKLAFDALKSLRYSKFTINLDGSLEGEFLAGIELDGIARNAPTPAGSGIAGAIVGRVLGQLAKIPFEFNIQIRGPFRALISTARSFDDPTLLIQPVLPEQLRDLPTTVTVQPEESEKVQ